MTTTADIVIIGGGVVGSSIAFSLLQDGFEGRVLIIERDPSYQFASSALAMGGVRQQFMSAVNIRMVQYSLTVLDQFPELMSELIRTNIFQTIDASVLSFSRFARNELFWDEAMI